MADGGGDPRLAGEARGGVRIACPRPIERLDHDATPQELVEGEIGGRRRATAKHALDGEPLRQRFSYARRGHGRVHCSIAGGADPAPAELEMRGTVGRHPRANYGDEDVGVVAIGAAWFRRH